MIYEEVVEIRWDEALFDEGEIWNWNGISV